MFSIRMAFPRTGQSGANFRRSSAFLMGSKSMLWRAGNMRDRSCLLNMRLNPASDIAHALVAALALQESSLQFYLATESQLVVAMARSFHVAARCTLLAVAAMLAIALQLLAPGVQAHGFMAEPKARNYLRNWQYCPHCVNNGGTWPTSKEGRLTWPDHAAPVRPLLRWQQGLLLQHGLADA